MGQGMLFCSVYLYVQLSIMFVQFHRQTACDHKIRPTPAVIHLTRDATAVSQVIRSLYLLCTLLYLATSWTDLTFCYLVPYPVFLPHCPHPFPHYLYRMRQKELPYLRSKYIQNQRRYGKCFSISGKHTECRFTSTCFEQIITQVAALNIDTLM